MDLQQIVERYAEAIEFVDSTTVSRKASARTGKLYLPGFKSLDEEPALDAIDDAWELLHPGERQTHLLKVPYPTPIRGAVDHVMTTDNPVAEAEEWSLEVKRLQFAGDNGKRNDHATEKVLSPYLKDRGMLHDALRLREYGFTRRIAIVAYSFDYDEGTIKEAYKRHETAEAHSAIHELEKNIMANGPLYTEPLIEFADSILRLRGLTSGPRAQTTFEAWKHPIGGRGVIFGWEIRRPSLESTFDPRHPW